MSGFWLKLIGIFGAIALLAGGCYYIYKQGYNKGHNESVVAVANYEKAIQDLNAAIAIRAAHITERVVTDYVTRRETVREVVYRNRDVIRNVVPEQSPLSRGWVYAHDQSVRILPIDFTLARDPTPSTTTPATALERVADNYRIAEETRQQLIQLQEFERARAAASEEVSNNQ